MSTPADKLTRLIGQLLGLAPRTMTTPTWDLMAERHILLGRLRRAVQADHLDEAEFLVALDQAGFYLENCGNGAHCIKPNPNTE